MTSRSTLAILCLALFFVHSLAVGDDTPPDNLYDTPLEDLLNIQVSTASKQAETIDKSPAVLSIVSEREIEAYGAITLAEVLDRVTSSFMAGTLPLPYGMLSIRGDVTAEQNNHVLILLNGRPLRDSIFSGLNQDIYTAFPVASIKQIEVIRGPGSVLYGTNAFVGVVNIITKDASRPGVTPTLRYGSFNSKQVTGFAAGSTGDWQFSGGLSYFDNDGWDFTAADWKTSNTTSTTESMKAYRRTFGANLLGKYKKFTLNAYYDREDIPFMSSESANPRWDLRGNHLGSRISTDLGYEDEISESWKHTINLTYNHLATLKRVTGAFNDASSNDALLEWANYFSVSPHLSATLGAVYEKQTGTGTNQESGRKTVPNYNLDVFSVYGQAGYQILDPLRFILGGQAIKFSTNNLNVVPRAAVIYSFSPELGLKLLYSKAFRAPSSAERQLVVIEPTRTINMGNATLQPETIGTLDLQAYYQTKAFQASATFFTSRQQNLINPITSAGVPRYENIGDQNTHGVEVEGKILPAPEWTVQGNLSYQSSETDQGILDNGHMPNLIAKIGIHYHSEKGYSLGVFNAFHRSPRQVDNGNGDTHIVNPKLTYFNYLTANLVLHLNKIFPLGSFPESEFQLYGTNLIGKQVYYPEYVNGVINSFPGRPGRAVYAGLAMKF